MMRRACTSRQCASRKGSIPGKGLGMSRPRRANGGVVQALAFLAASRSRLLGAPHLLDLPPKLVVRDSFAPLELLVRFLKNGPQGAYTALRQMLRLRLILYGQQHGDRLAVARDEH